MALAVVGPRRVESRETNVGSAERLLSTVGGGALAIAGLRRRGLGGMALAALGAALVHRGATGRCAVYRALGISSARGSDDEVTSAAATVNARRAVKVEHSITIAAPRALVYDLWRDFDQHPRFMSHVTSVQQQVDGTTRYTASVGGKELSWISEIVRDIPGELISWKALEGSDIAHAGSVNFRDTDDGIGTVVTLAMDYEPIGGRTGHAVSRMLGMSPEQIVRQDLENFRKLLLRA